MKLDVSYRHKTMPLRDLVWILAVIFLLCQFMATSSFSYGFFIGLLPIDLTYTITYTSVSTLIPGFNGIFGIAALLITVLLAVRGKNTNSY